MMQNFHLISNEFAFMQSVSLIIAKMEAVHWNMEDSKSGVSEGDIQKSHIV